MIDSKDGIIEPIPFIKSPSLEILPYSTFLSFDENKISISETDTNVTFTYDDIVNSNFPDGAMFGVLYYKSLDESGNSSLITGVPSLPFYNGNRISEVNIGKYDIDIETTAFSGLLRAGITLVRIAFDPSTVTLSDFQRADAIQYTIFEHQVLGFGKNDFSQTGDDTTFGAASFFDDECYGILMSIYATNLDFNTGSKWTFQKENSIEGVNYLNPARLFTGFERE